MSATNLRAITLLSMFGSENGANRTRLSNWLTQPGRWHGISAQDTYRRISLDGQGDVAADEWPPCEGARTPRRVDGRNSMRFSLTRSRAISALLSRELRQNVVRHGFDFRLGQRRGVWIRRLVLSDILRGHAVTTLVLIGVFVEVRHFRAEPA